jgi:hypothetical protein
MKEKCKMVNNNRCKKHIGIYRGTVEREKRCG